MRRRLVTIVGVLTIALGLAAAWLAWQVATLPTIDLQDAGVLGRTTIVLTGVAVALLLAGVGVLLKARSP